LSSYEKINRDGSPHKKKEKVKEKKMEVTINELLTKTLNTITPRLIRKKGILEKKYFFCVKLCPDRRRCLPIVY
jgi:hypothetical protein